MLFTSLLRTTGVLMVASSLGFGAASPALTTVTDVLLPGNVTRFDYQSFDPFTKTLYIAHMGDGELVVFNAAIRKVVAHLHGLPTVTGVLFVPELHRVFASVPGNHEIVVVESDSLKIIARIPDGEFPDGLAYASEIGKLFVSDEFGGKETVIDVKTNLLISTIDMGGEVGNTKYDPVTQQILTNVQTLNELVVIDPRTDKITGRHHLTGGDAPHGLLLDASKRLAFAACEGDSKLLVIDLNSFEVKQVFNTGNGPDVIAFDTELERLYVGTESGTVSIFQLRGQTLEKMDDLFVAPGAHTVSVDSQTHEVYLSLKNVKGHPILRIMKPTK